MLFKLVKTKELHVLLALLGSNSTIASCDLSMSKGPHDIFPLVLNFFEVNY